MFLSAGVVHILTGVGFHRVTSIGRLFPHLRWCGTVRGDDRDASE